MGQAEGFLAVAVAILFYGSNYVPTKKYPVGPDGIYFQWMLCTGVLIVGFLSLPLQSRDNYPVLEAGGFLGGGLWAAGNLLVIPVINRIGLGIGLLVWSVVNLLVGYGTGKLELFGMSATPVKSEALNLAGAALCVSSMFFFVFVKPDLRDATEIAQEAKHGKAINADAKNPLLREYPVDDSYNDDDILRSSNNNSNNNNNGDTSSNKGEKGGSSGASGPVSGLQRVLGFVGAAVAGTCYGFSLVPSQLWFEKAQKDGLDPSPFDYVFSQMAGVYATSTAAMIAYIVIKRNEPIMFPSVTLPAIISGAMWAIATASWIFASSKLGFVVSYPMITCGPTWVSSAWAVFYFREISDRTSLKWLAVALVVNLSGVLCIAFSSKS